MSYLFFLSYARRDAKGSPWLEDFYRRLALEVGVAAGLAADVDEKDIGFFDREGIEAGDKWPDSLGEALQSSKTFLCLYSKSYFKSEYCGKEFEIFRARVSSYVATGVAAPRLIIPVLWDKPSRLPERLPPAVSDIQYSHADFGKRYAGDGLAHLMKLKLDAEVENFISALADRIAREVESHDLPRLSNLEPLKNVANAFSEASIVPLSPELDPSSPGDIPTTTTPPIISGPDAAWYVYLAGREKDYHGVRTNISCYGDKGGYQWKPHLPPKEEMIGVITPGVASARGLSPQVLSLSKDLVKHLRKAEDENTVAVLVVDPWSVRVESYRQLMRDYDQYRLFNCGVIIVWNEADAETQATRDDLKLELKEAFKRNLNTVDEVFRDSVQTEEGLLSELTNVIEKVRERLRDKSKPARPVPANRGESFPNLDGTANTV